MSIMSARDPRYGYRRIQTFLERLGRPMSTDRPWRLWRLAGAGAAKAIPSTPIGPSTSAAAGESGTTHLAYDFVFDACANRQQLKCLTMIDEYIIG